MKEKSHRGDGQVILERLKTLIHEGNIRRVVVKHQGRSIAEFPLTAGVGGALLAPVVAAIGTTGLVLAAGKFPPLRSGWPLRERRWWILFR